MTTTPVYRSVAWGDHDSLCDLRLGRYDEVVRDPDYGMVTYAERPTVGELAIWFGSLYQKVMAGLSVCSVADVGGTIVGMASVGPEGAHVETRHVGILGIEIHRAWRDRGIGTSLLRHVLEACPGRFERVNLAVIPKNPRAKRVYEKLGFREYGRAPAAFQRAGVYHDFILMTREISPAASGPSRTVPVQGHSL